MLFRLAAVLSCLMASAAFAPAVFAQDRDLKTWGGPPNLGIDFKTGNSYGVSDFGAAKPEKPKRKRVVRARGTGKPTAAKTAKPVEKTADKPESKTAATPAASETKPASAEMKPTAGKAVVETGTVPAAAPAKPLPCRKFDPTTGMTREVRCR
jgi:opacity protein-like surface antigen